MTRPFTLFALLALCGTAAAEDTGQIKGKVKLGKGSDAANVYVFLKGDKLPYTAPKTPKQIAQKNKQFGPRVLAVLRGTTVEFPNGDKIMHNVYSRSTVTPFDLGHYKQGESKSVTFNKVGVIDIYCNIHPDMAATVLVVDNNFLTGVTADGSFELKDVPPGNWEVVAWQPSSPQASKPVAVKGGAAATVNLELAAPTPQGTHLNKEGLPYGRYK